MFSPTTKECKSLDLSNPTIAKVSSVTVLKALYQYYSRPAFSRPIDLIPGLTGLPDHQTKDSPHLYYTHISIISVYTGIYVCIYLYIMLPVTVFKNLYQHCSRVVSSQPHDRPLSTAALVRLLLHQTLNFPHYKVVPTKEPIVVEGAGLLEETLNLRLYKHRSPVLFSQPADLITGLLRPFIYPSTEKISPPIAFFKALYQHYSQLEFSRPTDRPLGIASLEQRLLRQLDSTGGHGIVAGKPEYLGPSLLWRRAAKDHLRPIAFPPDNEQPPSWSWMAYTGRIGYFDIRDSEVIWDDRIWIERCVYVSAKPYQAVWLSAQSWEFNQDKIKAACYDRPDQARHGGQRCVVIGRSSKDINTQTAYYLLLVTKTAPEDAWSRFGVALGEGPDLILENTCRDIKIV